MKKTTKITSLFVFLIAFQLGFSQTATTFAGTGALGATNGSANTAQFDTPTGIALDAASGIIYVTDLTNNLIRKITTAGIVSTFAGDGTQGANDGAPTAAQFNAPRGIATDTNGNVYVADTGNHKIRKITTAGVVTTFAGSGLQGANDATGTAAQFRSPSGIALDAAGNVYVADTGNHKIRKITAAGVVSTLAGTGTLGATEGAATTAAQFNGPRGVAVDASGNVYVADFGNNKIRKITSTAVVSTLAGTGDPGTTEGAATTAKFKNPYGIVIDATGNLYIGDSANNKIRKITAAGVVSTLAGRGITGDTDGAATSVAEFSVPIGVALDFSGSVFFADSNNNKIKKITGGSLATTQFDSVATSVYPNPSNGWFQVQTQNETDLDVFSLSGQKIRSQKTATGTAELDLTDLKTGIYVLKVNTQNKSEIIKLIKK